MAASIIRNGDGFDSHGASAPKSWWERSSLPRPLSVLITIAATAYAYHLVRALAARANELDFSHYYVSSLMIRQGLDPYITDIKPLATLLRLQVHGITLATYPPTFLLLFEPLTLLPPTWAFWLWTAMGAAFLGGTLYMLLDGLPQHMGLRLSLVGLVILYPPITSNFVWGQSQLMLLFFFVLFMRWLNCGRQSWAGAIAGLAGLLKIFPLLLLGYLAIRRQWKAILYAGMVLIAGGILTLTFVGVGTSADFVSAVPSMTTQRWLGRDTNVALGAIVSHIFWYSAAHHLGPLAGIGAQLEPGTDLVRRVMVSIAEFVVLALTVSATFRTSSGSLRSSESGDE
ncbi:MAG: glycosyltransferase family 87 protein, partial [Candidatus Binataceae bacterium]